MLNPLFELLPLFIVRMLAVRFCERVNHLDGVVITARPDVLIKLRRKS